MVKGPQLPPQRRYPRCVPCLPPPRAPLRLAHRPTVNNAGYVVGREHVGDIDEAVVEGMFATNVLGLIAMTQLLVRGAFSARAHASKSNYTQTLKPKSPGM